ncbi:MAG: hypothetical protein JNM18_09120 [Planctomycetaceae bacterium]|nr:hypothetical protein [Planctomycetaceae bacterium]
MPFIESPFAQFGPLDSHSTWIRFRGALHECTGSITFGSFNNPAKITSKVIKTWSKILQRLPTSRLLLKYRGFDCRSVRERYQSLFEAEAIDLERVEFQGASPFAEMLDLYNTRIDLALDPFPYNGGTTTILALYMGVPVVTSPGETVASRQSLSVLTALGVTETVARDLDEYVELAIGLAKDLPRLAQLRRTLRPLCLASGLFDGQKFTADLMNQLRQVWRDWVAQHPN